MVDVPVSPLVLRWAREYRGLNEEDAAQRLGISVAELTSYERGDRKPSVTLFEAFAAKYRLPTATLFRQTPPEPRPLPTDFRTIESRDPRYSFEFRVAVSNVRALLAQAERILDEDEESAVAHLPNYSTRLDPSDLGERERKRLAISVQEQISWRADDTFRRWRAYLERQNIFVFLQKFPLDDCKGFSLYEQLETPAIVVNKSEELVTARVFTLIHEYAHLLIRQPGISDHNDSNPVEAFCNKFASAFLMPRDALREVMPYWPNEPVDWPRSDVTDWAQRLKVSQQALALRLEQVGAAPGGFYGKFLWRGRASRPRREGSGANYVRTRLSELGAAFAATIIGALDRRVIDEAHATEALGIGPEHFGVVRESVTRQREWTIEGKRPQVLD